jgi:hypothetical protein
VPGLGFPYIGSCTSAPCGSQGSACGGSFGCCAGLVCTLPSPGHPAGVCESTTTSTTTTTLPSCGNGIVEAGEACDGNACDDSLGGGGCFPPGDADACRCCSSIVCWPHILKCCPGFNCAAGGMVPPFGNPVIGFCTTSTCTDKGRACLDTPDYLDCCDGLTCSVAPGQALPYPTFCLVVPGGPCTVDADCAGASAHCIDGTCAAP